MTIAVDLGRKATKTKTSKILCPFVSVHMRYLSVQCGERIPCKVILILSGLILWQVLNMFKTLNGRHRIKLSGG